jgi:hypothetical protein
MINAIQLYPLVWKGYEMLVSRTTLKSLLVISLLFFTLVCVADEHKRVFSVFLHTKCYEGAQKTSVVITNNTPYVLTVKPCGVFSEKTLHPSLFNIFNYEKYIVQQYGLKSEGVPIQKPAELGRNS